MLHSKTFFFSQYNKHVYVWKLHAMLKLRYFNFGRGRSVTGKTISLWLRMNEFEEHYKMKDSALALCTKIWTWINKLGVEFGLHGGFYYITLLCVIVLQKISLQIKLMLCYVIIFTSKWHPALTHTVSYCSFFARIGSVWHLVGVDYVNEWS